MMLTLEKTWWQEGNAGQRGKGRPFWRDQTSWILLFKFVFVDTQSFLYFSLPKIIFIVFALCAASRDLLRLKFFLEQEKTARRLKPNPAPPPKPDFLIAGKG